MKKKLIRLFFSGQNNIIQIIFLFFFCFQLNSKSVICLSPGLKARANAEFEVTTLILT